MSNERALWQKSGTLFWLDDGAGGKLLITERMPASAPDVQLRDPAEQVFLHKNEALLRHGATTMGSAAPRVFNHYKGRHNPMASFSMPWTDIYAALCVSSMFQTGETGGVVQQSGIPTIAGDQGLFVGVNSGLAEEDLMFEGYGGICSSISFSIPRVTDTDLGQPSFNSTWMFAQGLKTNAFRDATAATNVDAQEPYTSTDFTITVADSGTYTGTDVVSMDFNVGYGAVKSPNQGAYPDRYFFAGGLVGSGTITTLYGATESAGGDMYQVLDTAQENKTTVKITITAGANKSFVLDCLVGPPTAANEDGLVAARFPLTLVEGSTDNFDMGWDAGATLGWGTT